MDTKVNVKCKDIQITVKQVLLALRIFTQKPYHLSHQVSPTGKQTLSSKCLLTLYGLKETHG